MRWWRRSEATRVGPSNDYDYGVDANQVREGRGPVREEGRRVC